MLIRATQTDIAASGRTLEGLALPWNLRARVSDDGGRSFYEESFAPGSADKSLNERASFPLGYLHPWATGAPDKRPLGVVAFQRSSQGLIFAAKVSRTQAGDEMLELVNDGAVRDVSIGFRAMKQRSDGNHIIRTEIALEELSLAPVGHGQIPGAEVKAVRTLTLDDLARMEHDVALLLRP